MIQPAAVSILATWNEPILSKVPEYKSDGIWTLRNNQKETEDNAENENESYVGNASWEETSTNEGK